VKGETQLSAPHTLQYIGDQVPLCAPGVSQVVEQECSPMRDPPQPASIDMGLHAETVSARDAADDTGDTPHRPNVYVTDDPRDVSVAPERWNA
jgi:hypothetical protein